MEGRKYMESCTKGSRDSSISLKIHFQHGATKPRNSSLLSSNLQQGYCSIRLIFRSRRSGVSGPRQQSHSCLFASRVNTGCQTRYNKESLNGLHRRDRSQCRGSCNRFKQSFQKSRDFKIGNKFQFMNVT